MRVFFAAFVTMTVCVSSTVCAQSNLSLSKAASQTDIARPFSSAAADAAALSGRQAELFRPGGRHKNAIEAYHTEFAEVEIVLSEKFNLEDAYSLPTAPEYEPQILQENPQKLRVQIPSKQLEALIENGVEVDVLRKFILIGSPAAAAGSEADELSALGTCTGPYVHFDSGLNVPIPTDGSWGGSGMTIVGAPAGAIVSCVDVGYVIQHDYWSWLTIELSDSDYYFTHTLFDDWYDGSGYIDETRTGITTFNGRDVNQLWVLWAADGTYYGGGYIDYWWIKVYYYDSLYCPAAGGGDEYISRVQVGTIDNSSSSDGYADYTGISTEMTIGTTYPIIITNGDPYPDDQCCIWVDWNQDYDFEDSAEQIVASGGPAVFTADITPPGGAALGDTCMRVRLWYGGSANPCGTTSFGEVEDYTITVTSASVPVSVSGYIKTAGQVAIPDVSVTVTNGGGTALTNAGGYYQTTVLSPWTGTVTPSRPLWSFDPSQRSYTDLTTDVTDANFTGTYTANPTPKISGYVTTTGGDGLRDVLVSADSGQSDTTDSLGYYEFTVSSPGLLPEPWSGTVTPAKDYWQFEPVNIVYSDLSTDIADQNYTATYTGSANPVISGYVKTPDGVGVRNVQIAIHKGYEATFTDSNGLYELVVSGPWSGVVMASKDNWTFKPVQTVYSNVGADIPDQNYVGTFACTETGLGVRQKWAAIYNGPANGDDYARAIAADDLGNVYVTGESYSLSSDCVTIKYGPDGNKIWAAKYGDRYHCDYPKDIAVDDFGNVYVAGSSGCTFSGNEDYMTIKYDPNGVQLWAERYNGTGDDWPAAIAVDSLGNAYVTGGSDGAGTSLDSVTIKYDPNGVELWAKRYNGPANGDDITNGIVVDDGGNVYVTGGSDGEGTDGDSITIKYDPDGTELWVARYNNPENNGDGTGYIALDDFGNIFVAGVTDVNYDALIASIDYLVIKYDSDGNRIWVARYNGPGDAFDMPVGMGMDGAGNVYISGYSTDHMETYCNYLTVKYASDSNVPVWIARYDGPQHSDYTKAMAVDDAGNVYVTGCSWGEGWPPWSLRDYLTVKYGPDSNEPLWTARYDRTGYGSGDSVEDIAVDNNANVYVTGYSPGSGTGKDYMTIKYSSCCRIADLNCDGIVDTNDLSILSQQWLEPVLTADFVPTLGDGLVNFDDWAVFADAWQCTPSSPKWNPQCDIFPLGGDNIIDENDLAWFCWQWLADGADCADICPFPQGDDIVNIKDYAVLAEHWMTEQ